MKKIIITSLFLFSFFNTLFGQWNFSPAVNTPVCTSVKYQHEVRVIMDGKGGAIAAWLDHRSDATADSSNTDIYVQRLDNNGYAKWALNGIGICTNALDQPSINIVSDGASGAIIVWKDMRSGDEDIYAQKIDSSGNVLWAANGIAVCNDTNRQKGPKAVSDGSGGVIVTYEYKVNGSGNWDIYVQRLNGSGVKMWGTVGKNLSALSDDEKNPRIETDGNGGAIVVWTLYTAVPFDYDIIAQKIDAAGVASWASGGVYVCADAAFQVEPKIEPDGSGGAVIAWSDSITTGVADIYAQRIASSNGGKLWNAGNKVAICTDTSYQGAHDIATEGINGAVIAWKDHRGGNKDIYAQKIDLVNGNAQWVANGIPVASSLADEGNPNLWGDGWGGVICVWQDTMGPQGDVYAQKIDANGTLLWTAGGAPVATANNEQTQPKHVPDGSGGAIFFFMDNRLDSSDYNIYAHHLFWNGTENGIFEPYDLVDTRIFPNPFSESATLVVSGLGNRTAGLELQILDILGKQVAVQVMGNSESFVIHKADLENGIYFYEIRSSHSVISFGKFIITD